MTVYLDNAATSFPKPEAVVAEVTRALIRVGGNPGRGSHRMAEEAAGLIRSVRGKAAALFGVSDPSRIIFAKSATESINIVLKGWLRPGDRVVLTSMEHNAVVRPLARLRQRGVQTGVVSTSERGRVSARDLERALDPLPRLVVMVHASNVNGSLQPLEEIAGLCRSAGVPLLLDAAQTAGVQPIDAEALGIGMLACSGHKGLLGPTGVGLLYVSKDIDLEPLVEGGTGSRSEEERQPEELPDRFESGTLNLPGIAGLGAGVDTVLKRGPGAIRDHEIALAERMESGLAALRGVKIFAPEVRGTGAVAFTVEGMNPGDVAGLLDQGFDVAVRSGLHCAPLAHRTLGTFPEGAVRASVGFFSTESDVDGLLEAMAMVVSRRRPRC